MPTLTSTDPSQMTDEELDAVLAGEEIVLADESETPPAEEPKDPPENEDEDPKEDPKDPPEDDPKDDPKEDPKDPPEDEEEPAEDPKDPPAKKPTRKELRIQDLIHKFKAKEAPVATTPSDPTYKGMDYAAELNADPELIKKLEDDRQKYLEANMPAPQQRNEASDLAKFNLFQTRLEIDGPKVASKFPQFDKESDQFNKQAANAVNQMFLSTVGYDPESDTVQNTDLRYAEYVEGLMELAEELAAVKVATTQKNIKKQAAQTSLRPDGSQAKKLNLNQSPENMSDEELDAVINQIG